MTDVEASNAKIVTESVASVLAIQQVLGHTVMVWPKDLFFCGLCAL